MTGEVMEREAGGPRETRPIRLSGNENPFGPSPLAVEAMRKDAAMSYRYATNAAGPKERLIALLAEKEGVREEQVLVATGAGQVLMMYAGCLERQGDLAGGNIVTSQPSYLRFTRAMEEAGCEARTAPLTADLTDDLPALERLIDADTKCVYMCNPSECNASLAGLFSPRKAAVAHR